MKLTLMLAASAAFAALIQLDGNEPQRLEPGETLDLEIDEDDYSGIEISPVEKAAAPPPNFEQPRPDSIAANPELTSATAPGAQAAVEIEGRATEAGEPLPDSGNTQPAPDEAEAQTESTSTGADTLTGSGQETITSTEPVVTQHEGGGIRDSFVDQSQDPPPVQLGGAGGGAGGDSATGGQDAADTLSGGQENDSVSGQTGQDSISEGDGPDRTAALRDPTDADVRAAIAELKTKPSVERTGAGKIEVGSINDKLAEMGFKKINAAKRDEIGED